jgi:hypothetical protein
MRAETSWLRGVLVGAGLVLASVGVTAAAEMETSNLPRFTEEREAAALFFVKKHVPELLPLLEELKKINTPV